MMRTLESNRCYACGKLFCCAECCTEHIRKKHSCRESKCPLCRSEHLRVKNFENQEFLCHVVFHHLPLRCLFCGEIFKNCEELCKLGACNRRRLSKVAPEIQSEANKSLLSPETSSPLNKTPCGLLGAKRKEFSIESDYNGNFSNFISPPELSRKTSTPMHLDSASDKSIVFKTPRSPSFTFKTPKAANFAVKNARRNDRSGFQENNSQNKTDSKDAVNSLSCDSIYFSLASSSGITDHRTPLRSILSHQSPIPDSSKQEFSRTTEKKLGAMPEINEEMGLEKFEPEDMDLTDVMYNIISDDCSTGVAYQNVNQRPVKEQRNSGKVVRFSDQSEIKSEPEVTSVDELNGSDSEEFFEARQSISELSLATFDKLSTSATLINRENTKNSEKEKSERNVVPKTPEITDSNSKDMGQSSATSSSSSRVIMMVVVEKNGSVNATDLVPLIDSGLKKLESIETSGESPTGNPSAPALSPADPNGSSGTTMFSVDSYTRISTIECYSTPSSTFNVPQSPRDSVESSNSGTGGIFSVMAHAMRTAFRNLAGANSTRTVSREIVSHKENLASLSSNLDSNATSSNVLTNLASALIPRPAKRSRDMDDLSAPQSSEDVNIQNDIRSPVLKRSRGWYKIRAREPIARMRNNAVTSPRGISSETQCFQQGSLSIGDTILPIPSRAHQSTQTD